MQALGRPLLTTALAAVFIAVALGSPALSLAHALDHVAAVGGSWLTPRDLLAERDFEAIGRLARDAARIAV